MKTETQYRICRECPKDHYENCPKCFGFGLRADIDADVPVIAEEAMPHGGGPITVKWDRCPCCYSTIDGLPTSESRFDLWWLDEGSGMRPEEDEDLHEFVHRITRIAWQNGAYVGEEG